MNLPRSLLPALLALILAGTVQAQPAGGYIQDDAGLFSPAAVFEADQKIAHLRDTTHVAFWIRTMKVLPDDLIKELSGHSLKGQARAFKRFALEQAESEGRQGIYLLISDAPKHRLTMVVVTPESLSRLFTNTDADVLRRIFASSHLKDTPDQILAEGVEKVQYLLVVRSESTTVGWALIGAVGCGLLGLWLLFSVIRFRVPSSTPSGEAETLRRRNNLMGGMLGGMFGTVAGHWIYDALFGNDRDQVQPQTSSPEISTPQPDGTTTGGAQDYSV